MIFLVTEGEYSDYSVVGAFSSREKAEAHIAGREGYSIEGYEVDSIPPPVLGTQYTVQLRLDGSVAKTYDYKNHVVPVEHRQGERGYGDMPHFRSWPSYARIGMGIFTGVSYVSAEHAMKLAVEQRQKGLRENAAELPPLSRREVHDGE